MRGYNLDISEQNWEQNEFEENDSTQFLMLKAKIHNEI